MTAHEVMKRSLSWLSGQGWQAIYEAPSDDAPPLIDVTRQNTEIMDAVLVKSDPWRLCFVDALPSQGSESDRIWCFCWRLGHLTSLIRLESGHCRIDPNDWLAAAPEGEDWHALLQEHARHKCSRYVLAMPREYQQVVKARLDPALAELLHIQALFVDGDGVEPFMGWSW